MTEMMIVITVIAAVVLTAGLMYFFGVKSKKNAFPDEASCKSKLKEYREKQGAGLGLFEYCGYKCYICRNQ